MQAAPRPLAAAEMALVRLAYAADLPTPDEALRQLKAEALPAAPAGERRRHPTARPPLPPIPDLRGGSATAARGRGAAALPVPPRGRRPVCRSEPARWRAAGPVRPAPAVAPGSPTAPRLGRFEDVVALADANRDILSEDRAGARRAPRALRGRAASSSASPRADGRASPPTSPRALERWTGRRWVVALSKESRRADPRRGRAAPRTETRRENAAAHPLVREVLTRFPGAQIVDVRDTAPELRPRPIEELSATAMPHGSTSRGRRRLETLAGRSWRRGGAITQIRTRRDNGKTAACAT